MHIGIAGAGLLGRLLAWQLARAGHQVAVHDPAPHADARGAAGWTAAGMLSPLAELECSDAHVAQLGWRSLDLWQGIAAELPDIDFRRRGSLLLAHASDAGSAQRLLAVIAARASQPTAPQMHPPQLHVPQPRMPQRLSATELAALEPTLHRIAHAWLLDGEGQIDTAAAMWAFAEAGGASGVRWHWSHAVQCTAPGEIDGLRYDHVFDVRGLGARPLRQGWGNADEAASHWTAGLRGVRGEIIWLHAPGVVLHRPLRLLHPRARVYMVPRSDDRIVVGASEIESEDRSPISVRTLLDLLSAAHSVIPTLAEARVVHTESNLRPALPDNLPRVDSADGITHINGLFRHGWMVAPALVQDALRQAGLYPDSDGEAPTGPAADQSMNGARVMPDAPAATAMAQEIA